MSEDQVIKWFRGENQQTWDVDVYTLATQGPAGIRMAHYGNKVNTDETLLLKDIRSNATGIGSLNQQGIVSLA